jgi:hypothetical protein
MPPSPCLRQPSTAAALAASAPRSCLPSAH